MLAAIVMAAAVAHLPSYEAPPDRDLELSAEIPEGWSGRLVARYRPLEGGAWREVAFRRASEAELVAQIPGDALVYPGIAYYVVAQEDGGAREISGAEQRPHPVLIALDEQSLPEVALARRGGRRSQVKVSGEYVDFGRAKLPGREQLARDSYTRVEASFSYRFLRFVQGLSVGVGVLEGRAPTDFVNQPPLSATLTPDFRAGYRYGFAELHLGNAQVGFYGKLLLGINQETFGAGVEGKLRLGFDPGTRFELGAGHWSVLGSFGSFALAWDTVPKLPMSAGIVVSDLPNAKDAAVRLVYDVGYALGPATRVGVRLGYQARSTRFGAIGGGVTLSRDF